MYRPKTPKGSITFRPYLYAMGARTGARARQQRMTASSSTRARGCRTRRRSGWRVETPSRSPATRGRVDGDARYEPVGAKPCGFLLRPPLEPRVQARPAMGRRDERAHLQHAAQCRVAIEGKREGRVAHRLAVVREGDGDRGVAQPSSDLPRFDHLRPSLSISNLARPVGTRGASIVEVFKGRPVVDRKGPGGIPALFGQADPFFHRKIPLPPSREF